MRVQRILARHQRVPYYFWNAISVIAPVYLSALPHKYFGDPMVTAATITATMVCAELWMNRMLRIPFILSAMCLLLAGIAIAIERHFLIQVLEAWLNELNGSDYLPFRFRYQRPIFKELVNRLYRAKHRVGANGGKKLLDLVEVAMQKKMPLKMKLKTMENILIVYNFDFLLPTWGDTVPEVDCWKILPSKLISNTPASIKLEVNGPRVLCLDGGGTRGVVPLEILDYIENWFTENYPHKPSKINEYFDWICGTSIGGLLALCLSLRYSVSDCRKLIYKLKDVIFAGSRFYSLYNAKRYENELKLIFGENTKMSDIPVDTVRCAITVTTQELDREVISNYDPNTRNYLIWEVARSTSAAPSYFEPHQNSYTKKYYYDGGLTANNPTAAIISEINDVCRESSIRNGLILSLGTGTPPASQNPKLPTYRSLAVDTSSIPLWDNIKTLLTLPNQVCKTDGEVVKDVMTTCSLAECYYYRLSPSLPKFIDLDETDDYELLTMTYHSKSYTNTFKPRINEICEKLSEKYRSSLESEK